MLFSFNHFNFCFEKLQTCYIICDDVFNWTKITYYVIFVQLKTLPYVQSQRAFLFRPKILITKLLQSAFTCDGKGKEEKCTQEYKKSTRGQTAYTGELPK